ncbi:MAG: hypothetical protein ABFD82_15630 [Syntrophaceae bacterium]
MSKHPDLFIKELEPPYRFHTIDDMKTFIGGYSYTQYCCLMQIAKKHTIIQPPLLSLIPNRFILPLYEAKATINQIIEDVELTFDTDASSKQKETKHFNFAEDVPRSYFDLIRDLLDQGRDILKKKMTKKETRVAQSQPVSGLCASAKIQDLIDFDELLAEMLRYYLNTKNGKVCIFLIKSIFLMLAYDPKKLLLDKALLAKYKELSLYSTNDGLYSILKKRLMRIKQSIFNPHFAKLFRTSKEKIIRLQAPRNFKSNVIALIDQFSEKKDPIKIKRALKHLMTTYSASASNEELMKASGIMENILEKFLSFNDFFDNKFSQEKTEEFFFLFSSHIIRAENMIKNIVEEIPSLSLYLCKDLHDFFKGIYSGDCSHEIPLATAHLLAPRFFNIRVFDHSKWVGNIYMLDYSDKRTLIVDRIQIKSSTSTKSPGFVYRIINLLSCKLCTENGFTLLGPSSKISNYSHIERQYHACCTKRKQVQFKLDNEDIRNFECGISSKFYVLSGNKG